MSSLTTAGSVEEHSAVEECGTHLSLGIGGGRETGSSPAPRTVQLFGEVLSVKDDVRDGARRREPTASPAGRRKRGHSGKNKKASTGGDDGDYCRGATTTRDGGGSSARKKLRLTGAQAAMLEDSFRAHNILSHGEKQELARRVGLSARQVEVWFQNRRARTKLKQTELDCDLLRRWCDRLTHENARLRRDLADLRASATRLAVVCASCCDNKHHQVAVVAPRAGEMA